MFRSRQTKALIAAPALCLWERQPLDGCSSICSKTYSRLQNHNQGFYDLLCAREGQLGAAVHGKRAGQPLREISGDLGVFHGVTYHSDPSC